MALITGEGSALRETLDVNLALAPFWLGFALMSLNSDVAGAGQSLLARAFTAVSGYRVRVVAR